jgi:hypothetical protein
MPTIQGFQPSGIIKRLSQSVVQGPGLDRASVGAPELHETKERDQKKMFPQGVIVVCMIVIAENIAAQQIQKSAKTKSVIRKDPFKGNRLPSVPVIDSGRSLVV